MRINHFHLNVLSYHIKTYVCFIPFFFFVQFYTTKHIAMCQQVKILNVYNHYYV